MTTVFPNLIIRQEHGQKKQVRCHVAQFQEVNIDAITFAKFKSNGVLRELRI